MHNYFETIRSLCVQTDPCGLMKRSKSVHTDTYVLTSCRLLRFIRLKGVRMDGLRVASFGRLIVIRL